MRDKMPAQTGRKRWCFVMSPSGNIGSGVGSGDGSGVGSGGLGDGPGGVGDGPGGVGDGPGGVGGGGGALVFFRPNPIWFFVVEFPDVASKTM